MRQSIGLENREHILKDIETLSLEKYIDEIAGAALEGVGRCKTEKDVWSAVEVFMSRFCFNDVSHTNYRSYPLFIVDFQMFLLRRWCR